MKALRGFWQFLNTDVKDIPWGDVAEQGLEAIKSLPDAAEAWQDNAAKIQQLVPYAQKAGPLIKAFDDPIAQVAIAGLPFVSIGINLLKLGLALAKVEPNFESSVAIVAQLAYLQSLETVLGRLQDGEIKAKLEQVSLRKVIERQLNRLEITELTITQVNQVTTQFRESELAQQFGAALGEQLQEVGLDNRQTQRLVDQVAWGSHRYFHQAIVAAGESVEPLAEFYRNGGQQAQERYVSIDEYLRTQIEPLPLEQVFDESNPKVCFKDIYVQLTVQPLTQDGERKKDAIPICSHKWMQQILEQPANEPRKVMFVEGEAGRGKSVFCRMIADWTRVEFGSTFIPLRIRLRNIRSLAYNLTKTLEDCPDLEQVSFVRSKSDWLADKNTRFLIILDGFDELLLERRATEGLKEFLQQVTDFQRRSHHQLLVTGRPLALQGIERLITQNQDLERVQLQPMADQVREQWITKWQAIFGEVTANKLRQFLEACPQDITNTLAREPLLLYLLARLNREDHLTHEMFAPDSVQKTVLDQAETIYFWPESIQYSLTIEMGSSQQIQARLRIYRESINWVLEKQRQDENLRLTGLGDLDDLRELLQESALCVVQSGNETTRLEMVKQRFKASSNPINQILEKAQKDTGQSEEKALNNLLTTFYLKPGEGDRQGSVEFAHKSFGEYLFAERLATTLKRWTEVNERKRLRLDQRTVNEEIYDVFGYGGLSQEIVAYLFELLQESDIDRVQLFKRLHEFYQQWCQGEFLDAVPNENLPQKKLFQLLDQGICTGLRQVDVFAGLNVMILLFKLHAGAQPEGYPHLPEDSPRPEIWFHPCGNLEDNDFEEDRLLKIICYANALGLTTFVKTVGPHLISANLSYISLECVDLSGVNLSGANLLGADLSEAKLYGAYLTGVDLTKTRLYGTHFSHPEFGAARLNGVDLSGINLRGKFLMDVNLSSSNLSDANLSDANLSGANLSGANLTNANLSGTHLDNSFFEGANLSGADLTNVLAYGSHWMGVNLSRASLINADFTCTDLRKVRLDEADLSRISLRNADLRYSDLRNSNLSDANLTDAFLNNACLSDANLNGADLTNTNLSGTVIGWIDLSGTKGLTKEQLEGEDPPYLCGTQLPIGIDIDPDRDCERGDRDFLGLD